MFPSCRAWFSAAPPPSVGAINKPLAGKTGTSSDSRDTWFVGFSPDLACGVFVGFDNPRTLGKEPNGEDEQGATVAAPIFRDFMKPALADVQPTPFRVAPGIELVPVNAISGDPAPAGSPGSIMEAFKAGTAPGEANAPGAGVVGADVGGTAATPQRQRQRPAPRVARPPRAVPPPPEKSAKAPGDLLRPARASTPVRGLYPGQGRRTPLAMAVADRAEEFPSLLRRLRLFLLAIQRVLRDAEPGQIVLCAALGAFVGAVVDLLREGVAWLHVFDFGIPADHYLSEGIGIKTGRLLVVPLLGGLLLGLFALPMKRRISDIVDPIEANALHGGRMSLRRFACGSLS